MLILILVLSSMSASLLVIKTTEGDAERINISGSLRMQTYRISQHLLRLHYTADVDEATFLQQLNSFEARLAAPVLQELLQRPPDDAERKALEHVYTLWQQLRSKTLRVASMQAQHQLLMPDIDRFVDHIDAMVRLFQQSTERKMELVRGIEGVSIVLLLLVAGFALVNLYRTVVRPVDILARAAEKARQGDLKVRVDLDQEDELGLLARAFNAMSAELDLVYQDLESRVAQKTQKLSEQTQSLELLYETTRLINREENQSTAIKAILLRLSVAMGNGKLSLVLTEAATPFIAAGDWYDRSTTDALGMLANGRPQSINDSLWRFPIVDSGHLYGCLVWFAPASAQVSEKHQLIIAVSEHMASAFSRCWRSEQTYRLLLVEERATIARELHDSLAQALSFVKMQVAKWQTLADRGADAAELRSITGTIRQALNTAYAQLRELLVTFRLKLDEPGLQSALKATVAEYRERGGIEIDLDYRLGSTVIGANAEIHLLQIVREALANIVRHAHASRAAIRFEILENRDLIVEITDDGVGLRPGAGGIMHHGMSIMNERARSLGAELVIGNGEKGGVRVLLTCHAKALEPHGSSN